MEVSFDMKLTTPSYVVTRRLDDELVLLNLQNECYFGLDPVGARMWEVLASSASIEAALGPLLAEYDVDESRLRTDVKDLLNRLVDNGLVELESA